MKRQFKVTAARGLGGNNVNYDVSKLKALKIKLQDAMDYLEGFDDETFQAADGDPMTDDLQLYIQELDSAIRFFTDPGWDEHDDFNV